jgi:hypothetical protein
MLTPRTRWLHLAAVLIGALAAGSFPAAARADDVASLAADIDRLVAARWSEEQNTPAPAAYDA